MGTNGSHEDVSLHLDGCQIKFSLKIHGDHVWFLMKGSMSDKLFGGLLDLRGYHLRC